MLFIQMMIAHFIADMYLQTNRSLREKSKSIKANIYHGLFYAAVVTILSTMFGNFVDWIIIFAILFVSHSTVDILRYKVFSRRFNTDKNQKNDLLLFLTDQAIHIIILFFLPFISGNLNSVGREILVCFENVFSREFVEIQLVVFSIIFLIKPVSILIDKVVSYIASLNMSNNATSIENVDGKLNADKDALAPKTGSLIGILERIIMLILALFSLYTLLGIVLTAKSVARFNQLSDKSFAEKYLIGTLLSLLFVLVCVGLINNSAVIINIYYNR